MPVETTREICTICGKEYDDHHVYPRAPFAPFWCDDCTEEVNAACGGSWVACAYSATRLHNHPYEEAP